MAPKVLLPIMYDIVEKAFSSEKLLAAYYEIKFKPKNLILGNADITFSGINKDWFKKTSASLIDGSFQCLKRRKIYKSKLGSKEMRSLTLTSPRIKVIEKSILNAIQPFFEGEFFWSELSKDEFNVLLKNVEIAKTLKKNKSGFFQKNWIRKPMFSIFSYGFRPNLWAHNALQVVKSWPKNINWLINFDVETVFVKVNYHKLKNIFFKYCPYFQIWNIIKKFIKLGMIDFTLLISNNLSVSQGSLLAPFLFNIYFTELDKFVDKLKAEIFWPIEYKGQKKVILEFRRFQQKFFDNKKFASIVEKYGSLELVLAAFRKEKKIFYKKFGYNEEANRLSRNLFYVRHVEDILAGVIGPKLFVLKIIHQIKIFLQRNLKLNLKSINIINRNKTGVQFLGFIVYLPCDLLEVSRIEIFCVSSLTTKFLEMYIIDDYFKSKYIY